MGRVIEEGVGLTQAEELGVTPRYLAGVERDERNLTLNSVDSLARQLDVQPTVIPRRRA